MSGVPPILSAQNVGHRAGDTWLVHDCSFDLHPGFTALIGPNGAGKSTLLRTLSGLLSMDQGEIALDGRPLRPGHIPPIGYVPQFPGVYPKLTPLEFLMRTGAWSSASAGESKARNILERLGMKSKAHRPGATLHPAERRRLALASLWMRQVRVVLLDEPTAGLDPHERLAFWQELYRLAEEPESPVAYLVTTHLLVEVEAFCTRAMLLRSGTVEAKGTVEDFVRRADGHAYWAPGDTQRPWETTGRSEDHRLAVIAEEPGPDYQPRTPDLVDGYLWYIRHEGPAGGERRMRR